jgi:hypothetical protein
MIDFTLNKEIIDKKRGEIKFLSEGFALKISEKERELMDLKEKWYAIERPLKHEIELLYKERREHIQKYVEELDLVGEKVILPSKQIGSVKSTRVSPKGNLVLVVEIKDDIPIPGGLTTREFPYHDVVFYRDYLDEQLRKILE